MITYLTDQIIEYDILVEPKDVNLNLHSNILNKLISKTEGKCNDIGYIIKDSVSIINKSNGKIKYINGKNIIVFKINYKCNILKPSVGETIKCCIENITDAGVVAYLKLKDIDESFKQDNDIQDAPVICIIPLNRFKNVNDLTRNQRLNVKISAVRNKLNQNNIQIVGTPV